MTVSSSSSSSCCCCFVLKDRNTNAKDIVFFSWCSPACSCRSCWFWCVCFRRTLSLARWMVEVFWEDTMANPVVSTTKMILGFMCLFCAHSTERFCHTESKILRIVSAERNVLLLRQTACCFSIEQGSTKERKIAEKMEERKMDVYSLYRLKKISKEPSKFEHPRNLSSLSVHWDFQPSIIIITIITHPGSRKRAV